MYQQELVMLVDLLPWGLQVVLLNVALTSCNNLPLGCVQPSNGLALEYGSCLQLQQSLCMLAAILAVS